MIRICFVCLGNICRSPTAEGILLSLVDAAGMADQIHIDSAGTAAWHVGKRADSRSREEARKNGIELPSRARQFKPADFDRFDWVIAMDENNRTNLLRLTRTPADRAKIHMLRSFDPQSPAGASVPDPYYGGPQGFADVFDICMAGCVGLLKHVGDS